MESLVLVPRVVIACPICGGVGPCDCWKAHLTPDEREAAQLDLITRYLSVAAAKKERAQFLRKHPEFSTRGCGKRGQFGNTRASAVYRRIRVEQSS
jgi:hypothetical protein